MTDQDEFLFDVRIDEPGRDCNLYEYDMELEAWRLNTVYRPERRAPVDRAVVLQTGTESLPAVEAWLVASHSPFPECVVKARPVGLLEIRSEGGKDSFVVAVPAADEALAGVDSPDSLPSALRREIDAFLRMEYPDGGAEWIWNGPDRAAAAIHEARQAARLDRARSRPAGGATANWKPLGALAAGARRRSDTEPHTDAEYAYLRLPRRFQHYVDEYLTRGERILFAVNRPAMKSAVRRGLSSPRLQEGILIITDQQLAMVTEILPPGESNIRYGYIVSSGVPERIGSIAVRSRNDHAFLEIVWNARGGSQQTAWEFPGEAAEELAEGAGVVRAWQPVAEDTRLRRAYGPEPAEMELTDPAANDPEEMKKVADRMERGLAERIRAGERVLARALLPGWANRHKTARVFSVTDRRVLVVPDPSGGFKRIDEFAVDSITSVEFSSSILSSWLAINFLNGGKTQRYEIDIPNTAASFQVCFTSLRQQMTAVPIVDVVPIE
ncbi:MAG: inorganic diphosphatase [Anaerolineales bacterium]|nr:inorganic diphosphatase [Anaerolineales bacterium]